MGTSRLDSFIRRLAAERRVVLLGGLAVIAHGYARATQDADLWLEPMHSAREWAEFVCQILTTESGLRLVKLPHWQPVQDVAELEMIAEDVGMVRVIGLECPLDLFRRPNEMDESWFDEVWNRSTRKEDGVFLPDAVDVLLTKEDTGRSKDAGDQHFLEGKIRKDFGARLKSATIEEARALFSRYADHVVCEQAMENPEPAVRALAREILAEMSTQGDWFSRDVLVRLDEAH